MLCWMPLSTQPVSDAPAYVPTPDPEIELYKNRADVDVVHLVIVVPFIPVGSA
jgi:hypothetical protein